MRDLIRKGGLQASLFAGAWRMRPEPLALTLQDLDDILPVILETGGGGLAWWRVRGSNLASTPSGVALQDAYRLHSLRVALKEDDTRKTIMLLRDAGVEPLLLKGWAVARSYPERGLRPYGDIDLLVRAKDLHSATLALTSSPRQNTTVELHPGLVFPADADTEELFAHSRLAWMDSTQVRVLGPEDQLRYLCLHLFKHGARRPLLLVDIALLLDNIPRDFDWDYCTRGTRRQTDWTTSVLKLAHDVLGASLQGVPDAIAGWVLPDWLIPDVMRQWGTGMRHYNNEYAEHYLRNLRGVAGVVADRWPNRVDATRWAGLPMNGLPRFPLQLFYFLQGAAAFPPHALIRLVRSLLGLRRPGQWETSGMRVTRQHTVLRGVQPWDSS